MGYILVKADHGDSMLDRRLVKVSYCVIGDNKRYRFYDEDSAISMAVSISKSSKCVVPVYICRLYRTYSDCVPSDDFVSSEECYEMLAYAEWVKKSDVILYYYGV